MKEEKSKLRSTIRQIRNKIPVAEQKESSKAILQEIENLNVFKNSNIVLLFWSMEHEVFTHDFITKWSAKKKILLPVINNDELLVKEFSGQTSLQKSDKFPVYEPQGKTFDMLHKIDLVIVPGLAFDENYNRLGFGKGYYDRLLSGLKAYKIGVCFNFQMFNEIPYEITDVKMDLVISG